MVVLIRLLALLSLLPSALLAQEGQDRSSAQEEADDERILDTIQVVGSRRIVDRASATDTPVAVDLLPFGDLVARAGPFDVAQTLHYQLPSFNSTRQNGADGADLIDGAALRGLGSDRTLVLVNGKRHHQVALVNIFGSRDRGATGTDFNTFPLLAIDRIEVLRDGAAAQYGSDAIAGVMNIVLRRDIGCRGLGGTGAYTRGDGWNYLGSAYCGFSLGEGGFLGLTAEVQDRGRSDRSEPPGNPRIIGDSKVLNRTFFLNGEYPVADFTAYFFAGSQSRDASAAAFARGGIGSDDIPSRNSAAMYPNGFVPFINGDVVDHSATLGLRGAVGEWNADLSIAYGYNRLDYDITNTLNASIANLDLIRGGRGISPTRFDAGGLKFQQATTNLDFVRFFPDWLEGTNIAFGFEHRRERYWIRDGEPGSWIDADGPGGGNPGSQGFPGFQPGDVTNVGRRSHAVYLDVESDLNERLRLGGALRFEDYSDFGSTLDGKVTTRLRLTDALSVRASASTGFRAPALQQKFFSSTITDFISGVPVDVVIAANGSELARAAGIPNLRNEDARNFTLGLVFSPGQDWQMTVDAYHIEVDDRVVLSGEFDQSDPNIGDVLIQRNVGLARFFVNSVDTRTVGLDVVFTHERELAGNPFRTSLAANFNRTKVTRVNVPAALRGREEVVLGERDRLFVENALPRRKAILGFQYEADPALYELRIVHFGPLTLGTFSGTAAGVPNQRYADKTSADVSLSWKIGTGGLITVGGVNVFDKFPTRQNPDETDNGHIFESVQFGLSGAAWYLRYSQTWP
ncbi:MAG: TonB-dependent receptor [Lysobacterales bacterium]|jgi:iron complex outermembrane receptor protein|nr:MAG: TonB-dependent receptor [Xanthomonadales bacterium]